MMSPPLVGKNNTGKQLLLFTTMHIMEYHIAINF